MSSTGGLSTIKGFYVFGIAQTQIFTLQRVSTHENTISHFYLRSITKYKLNTKVGHSQLRGLKYKMQIS